MLQKKIIGPGLLVGDIAQPRGGLMLTGHKSHQLGLDADIWMMAMPARKLTYEERENTSAVSMLGGPVSLNKKVFKPGHVQVLKRAASHAQVARIFVHPAIKKGVCEATKEEKGRARWAQKNSALVWPPLSFSRADEVPRRHPWLCEPKGCPCW